METFTGTDLRPAEGDIGDRAALSGRRRRLPLPSAACPARIYWRYAVPILLVHGLALLAALPWFYSTTGLILFLVGVPVYGQGVNLVYHRLLSHRSFKVPRWLERVFVVGTLCSLQDTPARWVATHRFHHTHSDEPDDPHSPLVAFLWAHLGWLVTWNPQVHGLAHYEKYARDLLEDRFYLRLEKGWLWAAPYALHTLLYMAAGAGVALFGGGSPAEAVRFGLSLVAWGVFLRTVAVWHITWSVNSVTHLFGYRSYETGENSRNNWLVGLLAAGEGWHNNHHHDPASASNRHRWWEVDVTYGVIRLLGWCGLASDIVPPRHERQALLETQRIPR